MNNAYTFMRNKLVLSQRLETLKASVGMLTTARLIEFSLFALVPIIDSLVFRNEKYSNRKQPNSLNVSSRDSNSSSHHLKRQ